MIYGILGLLLGVILTVVVECLIIRRIVKGNKGGSIKHRTISEASNNIRRNR